MAEFSGWRQQASNKNLLINPRFRVNQRGQTEYTDNLKYTIDGWIVGYNVFPFGSILVKDDGLVVKLNDGQFLDLTQNFEKVYAGTLTASVMMDGKIHSATFDDFAAESGSVKPLQSGVLDVYNVEGKSIRFRVYKNKAILQAVKLEQGSISTLALDMMQPYTPQDYQRELRECQRYLQIYSGQVGVATKALPETNSGWLSTIPIKPMRIQPSITATNTLALRSGEEYRNVVSHAYNIWRENCPVLSLWLTLNNKLDTEAADMFVYGDGKLILSAEL